MNLDHCWANLPFLSCCWDRDALNTHQPSSWMDVRFGVAFVDWESKFAVVSKVLWFLWQWWSVMMESWRLLKLEEDTLSITLPCSSIFKTTKLKLRILRWVFPLLISKQSCGDIDKTRSFIAFLFDDICWSVCRVDEPPSLSIPPHSSDKFRPPRDSAYFPAQLRFPTNCIGFERSLFLRFVVEMHARFDEGMQQAVTFLGIFANTPDYASRFDPDWERFRTCLAHQWIPRFILSLLIKFTRAGWASVVHKEVEPVPTFRLPGWGPFGSPRTGWTPTFVIGHRETGWLWNSECRSSMSRTTPTFDSHASN